MEPQTAHLLEDLEIEGKTFERWNGQKDGASRESTWFCVDCGNPVRDPRRGGCPWCEED